MEDSAKDLGKGLTDGVAKLVKDRLKYPFFGAFILSWGITNYEVVLYLLSVSMSVNSKISHIQSYYDSHKLFTTTFIPIVYATIYIFIRYDVLIFVSKKLRDKKIEYNFELTKLVRLEKDKTTLEEINQLQTENKQLETENEGVRDELAHFKIRDEINELNKKLVSDRLEHALNDFSVGYFVNNGKLSRNEPITLQDIDAYNKEINKVTFEIREILKNENLEAKLNDFNKPLN